MSEPIDLQAAIRRIETDLEILLSSKHEVEKENLELRQENAALRDRILELTEPEYVPTTAGLKAVPDR